MQNDVDREVTGLAMDLEFWKNKKQLLQGIVGDMAVPLCSHLFVVVVAVPFPLLMTPISNLKS